MNDKNVYELCNAIILQAVNDYKIALSGRRNDDKTSPKKSIKDVEKFFRSEYFQLLSEIDGEVIISKIRKEFNQ